MKLFLKTIVLAVVMALFAACGSDFEWFPKANVAPKANAGEKQSVVVGDTVTLDGSASSDENGDKLTYSWSFTSRPTDSTASLSSTTAVSPTFTADKAGDYVLSLIVNDGTVSSAAATVTVTAYAGNAPPVAKITVSSTNVVTGRGIDADGSGSTDANSDQLTYSWILIVPAGSQAALSHNDTVTTSFTADLVGDYELKLTVSDGKGGSDTKTVNITATNTPPIAKASADKTAAFIGDLVHLDGSGSSDANGDPLTYLWAPAAAPTTPLLDENGNTCPTSDPCSKREKITIRPSVAGTYVLNLTVNDGYEINTNTDTNTVTITVTQGTGSITVTW